MLVSLMFEETGHFASRPQSQQFTPYRRWTKANRFRLSFHQRAIRNRRSFSKSPPINVSSLTIVFTLKELWIKIKNEFRLIVWYSTKMRYIFIWRHHVPTAHRRRVQKIKKGTDQNRLPPKRKISPFNSANARRGSQKKNRTEWNSEYSASHCQISRNIDCF